MFWKDRRIDICLGQGGLCSLKKSHLNLRKLLTTASNEVGRELGWHPLGMRIFSLRIVFLSPFFS